LFCWPGGSWDFPLMFDGKPLSDILYKMKTGEKAAAMFALLWKQSTRTESGATLEQLNHFEVEFIYQTRGGKTFLVIANFESNTE
jgi:hypothetical protein